MPKDEYLALTRAERAAFFAVPEPTDRPDVLSGDAAVNFMLQAGRGD